MHQEQNARNLYVVHGQDGFSVCETVSEREREESMGSNTCGSQPIVGGR